MLNNIWGQQLEEALAKARIGKEKKESETILLPPLPVMVIQKKRDADIYKIVPERGYYRVYRNGKHYCTADSHLEAEQSIP